MKVMLQGLTYIGSSNICMYILIDISKHFAENSMLFIAATHSSRAANNMYQ